MRVWLDDVRVMPCGYDIHVKTAPEALEFLASGHVTKISLDHDLGDDKEAGTGYHVACWIEEAAFHGSIPKLDWHIHSANPVGIRKMEKALRNADRYWRNQ